MSALEQSTYVSKPVLGGCWALTRWLVLLGMTMVILGCGRTSLTEADYIQRAEAHREAAEYQASIIEFRNALRLNPDNADARRALAELYLLMEDGVAAEEQVRWLSRPESGQNEDLRLLAQALLLQGRFKDLLSKVEAKPGLAPAARADILAARGRAHIASRMPAEARAAIGEAARLQPEALSVLQAQIDLALAQQDLSRAREVLGKAIDRFGDKPRLWLLQGHLSAGQASQQALSRAVELAPDGVLIASVQEAYVALVATRLRLGDLEGAQRDAQSFFERAPQSALANYAQGLLAYRSGKYRDAHRYLAEAYNQAPDYLPAVVLLGATNYALGNYNQAETLLARVVKEIPGHSRAQVLLGAARLRTRGPQQALDEYKAVASGAADDQALLAMIGAAALEAGDPQAGIEYLRRAVEVDPESIGTRRRLAAAYLSYGAYDEAIRELNLLTDKEESVAPSLMLAIAHARKGELFKAQQLVQKLAAENPKDLDVLYVLGIVQRIREDREASRGTFETMLRQEPRSVRARVQLAVLDLQDGKADQAQRQLSQGLELNPKNVTLMMALAQLEGSRGNEAEAIRWLERARAADPAAVRPRAFLVRHYLATGRTAEALKVSQEAVAADRTDALALALLAESQLATGETLGAVQTLQALVEQTPTSPEAYTRLGRAQTRANDLEGAIVSLRKALSLRSGYTPAQVSLAEVLIRRGQLDDALELARELTVAQPSAAIGFVLDGEVRMAGKQYAAAAAAFSKAWVREPSSRIAIRYAEALRESGDVRRAVTILRDWLKEQGDDPRVRLSLAETLHASGQKAAAEREYVAILRVQADNVVALNNLASLLHGRDDDRALEYATRAHQLRPNLGPVTDTLGWLLVDRGLDPERGRELLRKAAAQSPTIPEIHFHLAAALSRTGEPVEAKSILRSALEMPGDFPSRGQAMALLKKLDQS